MERNGEKRTEELEEELRVISVDVSRQVAEEQGRSDARTVQAATASESHVPFLTLPQPSSLLVVSFIACPNARRTGVDLSCLDPNPSHHL
jgi:hypothetical protein